MEQQPRTAEQLKYLLDRWLDDDPKSGRHGAVAVVSAHPLPVEHR
jgi:hypothetical protein